MRILLAVTLLGTLVAAHADIADLRATVARATFAAGCFWSTEAVFDRVDGVLATVAGYTGGDDSSPSYERVMRGVGGHREAVMVLYDPARVDFPTLVTVFWRSIDPTRSDGQFCDTGPQYRTAVYYHNAEQRRLSEESKAALEHWGRLPGPVVTEILPASKFYVAAAVQQDFYLRNPGEYGRYSFGCGRAERLRQVWGC
jgi:peptide-methionine (S)-S-oxide reductase